MNELEKYFESLNKKYSPDEDFDLGKEFLKQLDDE